MSHEHENYVKHSTFCFVIGVMLLYLCTNAYSVTQAKILLVGSVCLILGAVYSVYKESTGN